MVPLALEPFTVLMVLDHVGQPPVQDDCAACACSMHLINGNEKQRRQHVRREAKKGEFSHDDVGIHRDDQAGSDPNEHRDHGE